MGREAPSQTLSELPAGISGAVRVAVRNGNVMLRLRDEFGGASVLIRCTGSPAIDSWLGRYGNWL